MKLCCVTTQTFYWSKIKGWSCRMSKQLPGLTIVCSKMTAYVIESNVITANKTPDCCSDVLVFLRNFRSQEQSLIQASSGNNMSLQHWTDKRGFYGKCVRELVANLATNEISFYFLIFPPASIQRIRAAQIAWTSSPLTSTSPSTTNRKKDHTDIKMTHQITDLCHTWQIDWQTQE